LHRCIDFFLGEGSGEICIPEDKYKIEKRGHYEENFSFANHFYIQLSCKESYNLILMLEIVVLLKIKDADQFEEFERKAVALMKSHGRVLQSAFTPKKLFY